MTSASIDRLLRECTFLADAADDRELRSLQMAIVIEETFGVTLTDGQLDAGLLDDPSALRDLLAQMTSLA